MSTPDMPSSHHIVREQGPGDRPVLAARWLAVLLTRLAAHVAPERIRLADHGMCIVASSSTGFDVVVHELRRGWTVDLGGWSSEFESLDIVADFLLDAATGRIRLRVDVIGGRAMRWYAERKTSDVRGWVDIGGCGFVTFDFWSRRHRVVLQNAEAVQCRSPGAITRLVCSADA